MRDRNLFNRIRAAVRSIENGIPFARGNAQFVSEENNRESRLHSVQADFLRATRNDSPVVEGISFAWRLHEEDLCMCGDGLDVTPIEAEIDFDRLCAEPVTLSCRRLAARETDMFEFGHGTWHGRNGGRKPRAATRETIRYMRQLPREERMIAGDILRSDGEERRNRRRARACMRPLADVLEFPTRTTAADESAAA